MLFDPSPDYTNVRTCIASLEPYLTRTDDRRPRACETDEDDLREVCNAFLWMRQAAAEDDRPGQLWARWFARLDALLTEHEGLFVHPRETYTMSQFKMLRRRLRQLCDSAAVRDAAAAVAAAAAMDATAATRPRPKPAGADAALAAAAARRQLQPAAATRAAARALLAKLCGATTPGPAGQPGYFFQSKAEGETKYKSGLFGTRAECLRTAREFRLGEGPHSATRTEWYRVRAGGVVEWAGDIELG